MEMEMEMRNSLSLLISPKPEFDRIVSHSKMHATHTNGSHLNLFPFRLVFCLIWPQSCNFDNQWIHHSSVARYVKAFNLCRSILFFNLLSPLKFVFILGVFFFFCIRHSELKSANRTFEPLGNLNECLDVIDLDNVALRLYDTDPNAENS